MSGDEIIALAKPTRSSSGRRRRHSSRFRWRAPRGVLLDAEGKRFIDFNSS